jgi:hypothetical protein
MIKIAYRNCLFCKSMFKPKDNLKKGKYCSQYCYWESMKKRRGKETSAWKGEGAKKPAIHKWMSNNLNKPDKCSFCKENKYRLEWANISGDYLRDIEDYICLCQRCHSLWDRLAMKKWRTQKNKNVRLYGIDFDGTLCKGVGIPRKGYFDSKPPMENAIDAIKWMISVNTEPYVLTSREIHEWKDIVIWLYKNGFPGMMVTNRKKKGTLIFLDDRAIRFTSWQDFCKLLG